LYYDKIGANPIPKEETDGEDINLITAWGHMAEEYVGLWYHVQHPDEEVITDTNMYTMAGHPYIGGDVDGIIKMPDGHYALLEIKTTSFFNREAWANNAIPVPYEIQLRHYMAIMGLWEAVIVCMVDRDTFYVRHLVRDLDAEYALVKAVDSFWKDNVEKHHEPKPCGTPESIIKALRKYKLGNGVDKKIPNIKLGDEFYTKCVEYDTVDERYREVKAEADRLDNLRKEMTIPLIQAMGQAPDAYTTSPDGQTMFVLKQTVRKTTSSDKKYAEANLPEDVYNRIFTTKVSAPSLSIKKSSCAGKVGIPQMNP
jgi:predicted phage-related endonuclease